MRLATVPSVVAVLVLPQLAVGHGGPGQRAEPPASVAGEPASEGQESYIQRHMASEHHIGAFDMGSFFALHDLDRNGVWDVSSASEGKQ